MGKRKRKNKGKTPNPNIQNQKTPENPPPETIHAPYIPMQPINPFAIPDQNPNPHRNPNPNNFAISDQNPNAHRNPIPNNFAISDQNPSPHRNPHLNNFAISAQNPNPHRNPNPNNFAISDQIFKSDPSQYPPKMSIEQIVSNILKNPPAIGFEAAMEELGVGTRVSTELVEEVLKLSYGAGNEAIKFFRWAGWRLGGRKHTSGAWNLLIDLLGNEKLFDEIWSCIKVMKSEGIVSLETFSSLFSRYLDAEKVAEAEMSFEVMEQYGCLRDVVALNSFLKALCKHSMLNKAQEFHDKLKGEIKPNAETYAVLLEGCEKQVNVKKAKNVFGEMIIRIGWDPNNIAAYSAFLKTLINSNEAAEAFKFLNVLKGRKCFLDLDFYSKVLHLLHQVKDTTHCCGFWGVMKLSGIIPDLKVYNTMIAVYCDSQHFDAAYLLLDEMVFNGVLPNFKTYNCVFEALIGARNVEEASSIFREMTRNECYPLYSNYYAAIKMYLEVDDTEMGLTLWRQMIQKGVAPKEDVVSVLIEGFCNLKKVSEARKYCKEAISRGINIPPETMRKLRDALIMEGREEIYAQLVRSISIQV